jgi:hypothetical protein
MFKYLLLITSCTVTAQEMFVHTGQNIPVESTYTATAPTPTLDNPLAIKSSGISPELAVYNDLYENADITTLMAQQKKLEDKIAAKWFLPMRKENKELEWIKGMLDTPAANVLQEIRYGRPQQVVDAFKRMAEAKDKHRQLNLPGDLPFSGIIMDTALKYVKENPEINCKVKRIICESLL